MAFASFDGKGGSAPMSDINMVPLIDVMLVLLVIFIITAPLLTHSVKIDLPKATSTPNVTRVENIQRAIDGASQVFWNGEPVDRAQMIDRMREAGRLPVTPEVHLRVDRDARYEPVAEAMSEAAKAGLSKIGFVTDPAPQL